MIQVSLPTNQTHSKEAETSVIGSVFIDSGVADEIIPQLEERDFYFSSHRHIWRMITKLYYEHEPIDVVTVTEKLNNSNLLSDIGGVAYLTSIAESVPTTANVLHYCNIIKSKALRRRGITVGEKIKQLSEQQDYENDEAYLNMIEALALEIRPKEQGNLLHLKDYRYQYFDYLVQRDDFIKTGFPKFDEWIGGIGRGWLYILAGRPSVGKTAKVLQMAVGIAKSGAGNVLVFSQEMNRSQLLNRMVSPISGVLASKIRRKECTPDELAKVEEAYNYLQTLPIFVEDSSKISITYVRSVARQIKRQYGELGAIIVDYLTIMDIPQMSGQTRSQAIGEVTRMAKKIAMELNVPFIMLAQLNRAGANSEEPRLEHLRDSGEIEQDADVVEFLWHNPNDVSTNGKIIKSLIAKGRDIGINKFEYLFKGWIQKYEEL